MESDAPRKDSARWRVWLSSVLLLLTVVALAGAKRQFDRLNEHASELKTGSAPSMMVSLQLAKNAETAAQILSEWGAQGNLGHALDNLDLDDALISSYWWLGFLFVIGGLVSIPKDWRPGVVAVAIVVLPAATSAAGWFDELENAQLRQQVALAACAPPSTVGCPIPDHRRPNPFVLTGVPEFRVAVEHARAFAVAKFLLLIAAGTGVLIILGVHAVRLRTHGNRGGARLNSSKKFACLMSHELKAIRGQGTTDDDLDTSAGPAGEHWVAYRNSEVVGLALSGGGIRSATFNLGLLQGLARLKDGAVLGFIDYLSTVSGGGYIGGAWSAGMSRNHTRGIYRDFFVCTDQPTSRGGAGETESVRHLREFSNFLVPRWGFFNVESWQAFIVAAGALLPSLLITIAVLLFCLLAYLGSSIHTAMENRWPGIIFATLVTALVLLGFEEWFRRSEGETLKKEQGHHRAQLRVHVMSSLVVLVMLPFILDRMWRPHASGSTDSADRWAAALGIEFGGGKSWWFNSQLFDPAVALLTCGLFLLAIRFVVMLLRRTGGAEPFLIAFDRTLMRVVGLAVLFAAVAGVWHLGVNLQALTKWLVALTAASGGAFALLRNWFSTLQKPRSASFTDRLKPFLPQILAYGTIVLGTAVIASALIQFAGRDIGLWLGAVALAAVTLTIGLFIDPQTFGFHAFYRDRIARAYLGASNPETPKAADNRQFYVRSQDDLSLKDLPGKPLHLVCCAANDLEADQVESLSRGARSATLSRHGISLGEHWARADDLSLSSALTASAAAFNSNMGQLSVRLGPGVTFLMTALNLRLGLWHEHPDSKRKGARAMPGLLFYKEMFQSTAASRDDLHLSDGGHFENLGLYELVRRHCRYIIVCDATADPDVAFDDFGIAARRVRQDFGVDIQIDLAPLKPGDDGYSRQHMVVGSIEYGPLDQGILLYIKPAITGDEEPDIRQYRRRNNLFPHESTGDQFYDEAQWESYRRLGNHTADEALRFLNRLDGNQLTAQRFFTEARREWYPTSPDLATRVISMTSRLTAIEADLRSDDAATIASEVFPELKEIRPVEFSTSADAPPPTLSEAARAETISLSWILRVLQLMEDAWVQCDLDVQWNHPLNLGWMNVFARWATAPTFQMWWPVLSPMYGSGFLRFMHERFPVLDTLTRGKGVIVLHKAEGQSVPPGIASTSWEHVLGRPLPKAPSADRPICSYVIELERGDPKPRLQVGLLAMTVSAGVVRWKAEEFFVPPSLWSGGIGSAFLTQFLSHVDQSGGGGKFFTEAIHECRVEIVTNVKTDPASRAQEMGYLDFYRPHGFELRRIDKAGQKFELVRKSVTRPASPA
jgi:hypothetical protein